jgi:hypothetical protein
LSDLRYVLVAEFDTKPQADQASALLVSLGPFAYHFSAFDDEGHEVWSEIGTVPGAHDVRV